MSDYNPGGRPFTGRKFLMVMLGFFGVIIAVNALMATLAVRNFHGLVVENGYVASQHFNDDHKRFLAQEARGWVVEAKAENGDVLVRFTDGQGAPLTGLTVTAQALRVTDARLDQPLNFVEAAPGVYQAAAMLTPGRWRIALAAEGNGPLWSASREIALRR